MSISTGKWLAAVPAAACACWRTTEGSPPHACRRTSMPSNGFTDGTAPAIYFPASAKCHEWLRSEETMTPDSNSPLHTPLNGNAEIEAALDDIFERAQKSVRIFDQALGRGYNTIKRYESLRRFLLQNR